MILVGSSFFLRRLWSSRDRCLQGILGFSLYCFAADVSVVHGLGGAFSSVSLCCADPVTSQQFPSLFSCGTLLHSSCVTGSVVVAVLITVRHSEFEAHFGFNFFLFAQPPSCSMFFFSLCFVIVVDPSPNPSYLYMICSTYMDTFWSVVASV